VTYFEAMGRQLTIALAVALAALAVFASSARASCVATTAAEQRARADVIFDGVALEGATPTGVQRFRVTRYLKGQGPNVVRVNTKNIRRADGSGVVTSVSIVARKGERWRIFADGSPRKILRSSVCDGSRQR
jgi:hypothetical protein